MRNLKNLDLYRKTSTDSDYQTYKGGLITLAAILIMSFLLISETLSYFDHKIVKVTLIDQNTSNSPVKVNLDISLPHVPCLPLSLDQQDSVNKHIVDASTNLKKIRINSQGEQITETLEKTLDNLKGMIDRSEGCRVVGFIYINRVPGNFHLSFHVAHELVSRLPREYLNKIKFSHVINHLSFGEENHSESLEKEFEAENFRLYDGKKVYDKDFMYKHEYFLKIIPVQFIDQCTDEEINSYQYSLNLNSDKAHGLFGAVYFRYDFENITMRYTKVDKKLSEFIVSLCAILGGVFALLGLVNYIVT